MSLRPVVHALGLARSSSDASEDAYAVDAAAGLLALADGASSAWRAGDWAAALVAAWVATPPTRPRDGGHAAAFGRWLTDVRDRFGADEVAHEDATRPWFTVAAAARGSHAAFAGVHLSALDGRRPRWRVSAVGDVCCFHVREERLLTATPLDDPERFTSRPDLVSSLVEDPTPAVTVVQGDLRADDMLVLASDALAQFLLRLDVTGEPVWPLVRGLDPAGFRTLVAAGVAARMLEPDDVTLIRVVLRREVLA